MGKTNESAVRAAAERVRLLCVDVDGTLTDGGMYYSADGEAMKRFDTRDAMGMSLVRDQGIVVAILTSEESDIVAARARKLQIDDVFFGVKDKVSCMAELIERRGLRWGDVAFVGDDVNDHAVLAKVGLSACPRDAPGDTCRKVMYVCRAPGGHGAVREVCELILSARNGRPYYPA